MHITDLFFEEEISCLADGQLRNQWLAESKLRSRRLSTYPQDSPRYEKRIMETDKPSPSQSHCNYTHMANVDSNLNLFSEGREMDVEIGDRIACFTQTRRTLFFAKSDHVGTREMDFGICNEIASIIDVLIPF